MALRLLLSAALVGGVALGASDSAACPTICSTASLWGTGDGMSNFAPCECAVDGSAASLSSCLCNTCYMVVGDRVFAYAPTASKGCPVGSTDCASCPRGSGLADSAASKTVTTPAPSSEPSTAAPSATAAPQSTAPTHTDSSIAVQSSGSGAPSAVVIVAIAACAVGLAGGLVATIWFYLRVRAQREQAHAAAVAHEEESVQYVIVQSVNAPLPAHSER